ncbi:MAG: HAD family hydrolase [Acholeplasma sp.]|nr:HAD family hydrolase [Acholeplasma sp.]
MIKGIIFDLDGTLLDTVGDIRNSLNYILEKYGYKTLNDSSVKQYLGNGGNALVKKALNDPTLENDVLHSIINEYTEHYKAHNNILTKPYPNVIELLTCLKNKHIKMAITSNKIQESVTTLNQDTFLGLMDVAIGEKEGIPLKPNPKMLFIALEKMGLKPNEVLFVGDTEVDLQTARNANLKCVAVTWGFRDKDFLASLEPDFIISNPLDILSII